MPNQSSACGCGLFSLSPRFGSRIADWSKPSTRPGPSRCSAVQAVQADLSTIGWPRMPYSQSIRTQGGGVDKQAAKPVPQ